MEIVYLSSSLIAFCHNRSCPDIYFDIESLVKVNRWSADNNQSGFSRQTRNVHTVICLSLHAGWPPFGYESIGHEQLTALEQGKAFRHRYDWWCPIEPCPNWMLPSTRVSTPTTAISSSFYRPKHRLLHNA